MVHKWWNNPKTDRSLEIDHSNDEKAQGTLPFGDSGCISKPSQDYKATPAPSPLPTTSHQPSPGGGGGGFNPRSTNRTWKRSLDPVYNASSGTWTENPLLSTVQVSWASLFCQSINQYLHMSIWTTTGVCIPRANMDRNWYSLCPWYEWSQGFRWSWALVSKWRLEVREWSQRGN